MRGSNAATKTVPLVGARSPAAIMAVALAGSSPAHESASFSPSFNARVTGGADVPPRTYAAARISSSAIDLHPLQTGVGTFRTARLVTGVPRAVLAQSNNIRGVVERSGSREEGAADCIRIDRNARGLERADAFGGEASTCDDFNVRVSGCVQRAPDVEDQFGHDARRFERSHHLPKGAIDERPGRIQADAP